MQTMMSDTFHRRANFLPAVDSKAPFTFPIETKAKVQGYENVKIWDEQAGKFKSWMWRTCNEGPDLNFRGSIPVFMLPHVHIVLRNAIELLRSWEPQENDNWSLQLEAHVMANLISGFSHQKCFVDEILAPGADHCYVQMLLQWTTWQGPATHDWSDLMQMLLSSLLSGLELSETKHLSSNLHNVSVLEPVCCKLVTILAGDVSRFRSYTPLHVMRTLPQLFSQSTDSQKQKIVLDMTNHAIDFFASVASRELRACLRALRYFPSLNLAPLGPLASFHKNQILSTCGHAFASRCMEKEYEIYDEILAAATASSAFASK